MRAEDIESLIAVGPPSLAADGSFAVFATSRPDIAANREVGQLWRVDLPGGVPRRITRGVADSSPRLDDEGSLIGFLRPDARGARQVFVLPIGGGEAIQATDIAGGVRSFRFSPDGTLVIAVGVDLEPGRYGTVPGVSADNESPRRVTGVRWHANGVGSTIGKTPHIFVAAVPRPEAEPSYDRAATPSGGEAEAAPAVIEDARQLTSGEDSYSGAVFHGAGHEVLAIRAPFQRDRADLRTTLVALRVDGSGERELIPLDAHLSIVDVEVAADGAIAVLASSVGESGTDFVAPGVALFLIEDGGLRPLTDPEEFDLGESGSHITAAGSDFLVQHRTRGRVHLLRVTREGEVTVILGEDRIVTSHAASMNGERMVAAVGLSHRFGELELVGAGLVTSFGSASAALVSGSIAEVNTAGRDGYPLHGWVATPGGPGPFPTLLLIHGGPYAQYGIQLFDEVQVLVDAGYAVVYSNPRGSAGYGRAHGRAVRGAMGTVDYHDVIDFFDAAISSDVRLDGSRVGIMGGSYGGYMTAWIIAHDHRFSAAIVERGFLDTETFRGTSDIGSFFGDEYNGADPDQIRAQSPMAVVGSVRTPTLVLHSENDFRCPLEQATRYYSALKRQATPAELLVFPGEDHELTRHGQPRHRVERFAAVLDWWARYLPVATERS